MSHRLPQLPFPKSSLDPHISEETLEFHHGKHHAGYIKKLNELIRGTQFEHMSLEDVVRKSSGAIFNNAAQSWNHEFYFNCLTPDSRRPNQQFRSLLDRDFGSTDSFLEEFKKAGVAHFGSGYAWLVQDRRSGKLEVVTAANADNPLKWGGRPILSCDLWEHAYYIDYRNERPRYMDAFIELLNWDFAASNLGTASSEATQAA